MTQQKQTKAADLEQYLAGLEEIFRHREEILARRGSQPIDIDVVELINRMREEGDAENLGLSAGSDWGDGILEAGGAGL